MKGLVPRPRLSKEISIRLREAPAVALLGARQTGKTTLARLVADQHKTATIFDLEREASRRALSTPELTLAECRGLVVLDEIQRLPGLFDVLRPLCDRPRRPARFLLLGSASLDLMRGVSESLAGRVSLLPMPGFTVDEVGAAHQNRLWLRGSFPRAYRARSAAARQRWLESFVSTFVERDVPQFGLRVPAAALRRFWTMLAHYHGQIWNASEIARSMDASYHTMQNYLDILEGAFLVRVLRPWHENLKKRQVKSPKTYFRDSGLLHYVLGIDDMRGLRSHPRYGASWEGFALEQALAFLGDRDAWFWATQGGAELDLLVLRKGKRYGFEFKCSDAPGMTRSLHTALSDLGLERAWLVYPGLERYAVHEKVDVVPLAGFPGVVGEI